MTTPIHKKSDGFILPLVVVFMVIVSLLLASLMETESHYETLHAEFVHDQQKQVHKRLKIVASTRGVHYNEQS